MTAPTPDHSARPWQKTVPDNVAFGPDAEPDQREFASDGTFQIAPARVVAPTPEQMRALAGEVDNYAADMHVVSTSLRAAADGVDRLRVERDDWVRMFCDAEEGRRRNRLALDVLRSELVGDDSDTPAWKRVAYQRRELRAMNRNQDRLRAELDESDAERTHFKAARDSLIDDVNSLRTDRDFMLQTIIGLRAVIENAPHAHGSCLKQSDEGFDDRQPCTCWKADAS